MLLTFSATAFAETEYKNPKDKTLERTLEKHDRDLVLQKMQNLYNEEKRLKDQLQSEDDRAEKQRIDTRLGQIQAELVRSNTRMARGDSGGTIVEFGDRGDLYGIAATHDWWGYYHTPIDRIASELSDTGPELGLIF